MSASRKLQRRKARPGQLKAAVDGIQAAVSTLGQMGAVPEVLQDLKAQTQRVSLLADALAGDYETLLSQLEIQREVTLRMLSEASDATGNRYDWRDAEERHRRMVVEERTREEG